MDLQCAALITAPCLHVKMLKQGIKDAKDSYVHIYFMIVSELHLSVPMQMRRDSLHVFALRGDESVMRRANHCSVFARSHVKSKELLVQGIISLCLSPI